MNFTSTQTPQTQRGILNMEPQNQPSRFVLISADQLKQLIDAAENLMCATGAVGEHCRNLGDDRESDARKMERMQDELQRVINGTPDVVTAQGPRLPELRPITTQLLRIGASL